MSSSTNTSMSISLPTTLTQCQNATIKWSGPSGLDKMIEVFVKGTNYFAESWGQASDFSGASGSITWLVDIAAGAEVAIEIRNTNGSLWSTSPYHTIAAGSTGDCLGKDAGQLATASMAALASSLQSASPSLFTYLSTTSSTSTSTASPTTTLASSATTTSAAAPTSTSSSKSGSLPPGSIAGATIGSLCGLGLAILLFLFYRKRSSSSTSYATSYISSTTRSRSRRASLNPIERWRHANAQRPPSTGTWVYSPPSVLLDDSTSIAPRMSEQQQPRGGSYPPTMATMPLPTSMSMRGYSGVAEIIVDPFAGGPPLDGGSRGSSQQQQQQPGFEQFRSESAQQQFRGIAEVMEDTSSRGHEGPSGRFGSPGYPHWG